MQQVKAPRAGPEGYVLALALLVPLGLMALAGAQLAGAGPGVLSTPAFAPDGQQLMAGRPAPLYPTPPPTLAPPTATPRPTEAPQAATAADSTTADPASAPDLHGSRTYTVQPGDELKQIAASYGVSIWSIIDANRIPNPDSLRVGQVLQIPDN